MLKNLVSLLISGVLAAGASLMLNRYTAFISADWIYSLAYFTGLCFIFNLVSAAKAASDAFVELLMAGIVIKLLLALIVIVLYSLWNRACFFNFSIHFILHYILFTIFEIRYLLQTIHFNAAKAPDHEN